MTISASSLGKRFNREWIFKNINIEFTEGNIYAVIGPNGSGKSTLMQVLWGQIPQSEGTVKYFLDHKEIAIEEVYQFASVATPYMDLLEEFTLKEMVSFHFKFKRLVNRITQNQFIERLGLERASDKPIRQFSSGMRQKLRLGLAMFSEHHVLFLDEPTTNLDKETSEWFQRELAQIRKKSVIFIATNQRSDYPDDAIQFRINDYKMVTRLQTAGIEAS